MLAIPWTNEKHQDEPGAFHWCLDQESKSTTSVPVQDIFVRLSAPKLSLNSFDSLDQRKTPG
jgi:hypothetical protein